MDRHQFQGIVESALREDIGFGDVTTNCCIAEETMATAIFLAKEAGVLCGIEVVKETFQQLDSHLKVEFFYKDGDQISKGDILGRIQGSARSLLQGERVALNFLQHLSGIATKTRNYVDRLKDFSVKIVDTRKTTPNMRILEKYAVTQGGGYNHRFSLDDGLLIKDNHIKGAGGVGPAIALAREKAPHVLKIEIEVSNLDELAEALEAGADIIMLDNMEVPMLKQSVEIIAGAALVEASGNMGDRDLVEIARTGVDLISIGALTNAVQGLDISLKFL